MSRLEQIGLKLVRANTLLNVYGLITIIAVNLYPKDVPFSSTVGWLFMYYAWAALYVGIPLFVVTIGLAPVGTFVNRTEEGATYLRAFLLNQALVALIWIAPFIYVLLSR